MILHLLFDDKFADYVIDLFGEIKEVKSTFAFISYEDKIRYIKQIDKIDFFYINKGGIEQLLSNINKYNAVVFHGAFYPWQEEILKLIPNNIHKIWHVWGGEIYGQSDLSCTFLAPLTKKINHFHKLFKKKTSNYIFPKKLFKKFNYCLTSIEEEYIFVRDYIGIDNDFKYLWYSCYTIEDTIGKSLLNEECSGNNIWLGNSATIENNYFDIFLYLKRYLNIENRKIIVPLSYGAPWIRNYIIKLGNLLFKNKFSPIINFLPREVYNSKMLDCSVMIQPHWRQQAHGNILTGLWLGMRVYLSKKSIEYKFLKRIGIIVFSIEDDLNKNSAIFARLSNEEMNINRKILTEHYGKKKVKEAIFNIAIEIDKKK